MNSTSSHLFLALTGYTVTTMSDQALEAFGFFLRLKIPFLKEFIYHLPRELTNIVTKS